MSAIIRGAEIEEKFRQIYLDSMTDLLAKVRSVNVK
jgi:hypothetical protein